MEDEINEFLKFWEERGVVLPNPDNYPNSFLWHYKMWKLYKNKYQ